MKSWIKKVVNNRKGNGPQIILEQTSQKKVISFDRSRDKVNANKRQINKQLQQPQYAEQQRESQVGQNQPNIYNMQIAKKIAQQEPWVEAQAEIINHLISMDFLIKVSKNIEGEFIMLVQLKRILCSQAINLVELRNFISLLTLPYQYYPIRALVWKISSGYLPQKKQKWISFMEGSLIKYQTLLKQHIMQTVIRKKMKKNLSHKQSKQQKIEPQMQNGVSSNQSKPDHPLNSQKDSKWKTYFQDYQLWNLIQQDTIRTRKSCTFFQQEHIIELDYQQQNSEKNQSTSFLPNQLHLSKNSKKISTYYYDSLTRIIFIYCKQHPQTGYWQGMNELVAVIYYSFTNKNSQYFRRVSQSDTYFVFQILMQKLGKKHFGLGQKYSNRFMELLRKIDIKMYEYLESRKIDISVFVIRWMLALFANQFQIDQCLILWDSIFSAPEQYKIAIPQFLIFLGLGLLHLNRKQIIEQDENPLVLLSKIKRSPKQIVDKARSICKFYEKML